MSSAYPSRSRCRRRISGGATSGRAGADLSLLRAVCAQPMEIYVDDEAKLTLHGLVQHYIMLNEEEKNRKLNDLLDALDFNQARSARRWDFGSGLGWALSHSRPPGCLAGTLTTGGRGRL